MPDQQTIERAREDAREGKSPTTQAGVQGRETEAGNTDFLRKVLAGLALRICVSGPPPTPPGRADPKP
jgi:hypothetical protein